MTKCEIQVIPPQSIAPEASQQNSKAAVGPSPPVLAPEMPLPEPSSKPDTTQVCALVCNIVD